MLIIAKRFETLPEVIERDASTNLPLLSEADNLMKIVLAYQALPYSVAEYGCGKKASLIIDQLIGKGIPPWGIRRGLIVERDMSPAAMAETDPHRRDHAITLANPLAELGDLEDPVLRELLERAGAKRRGNRTLLVGDFQLDLSPVVQFSESRSHIITLVTFWDEESNRAVERVIDPTLCLDKAFTVGEVRKYLNAPEALIFTAPLLGRFRLDADYLTDEHRAAIDRLQESGQDPDALSQVDHDDLARALMGAEVDSIGDPGTWTYANNFHGVDRKHTRRQRSETGSGDPLRDAVRELLEARNAHEADVAEKRTIVEALVNHAHVRRAVRKDAKWSRDRLEPLADTALTVVYHNALKELASALRDGRDLAEYLADDQAHVPLRGLGVRLRRRIDRLGAVSVDDDDHIDARALTPLFRKAAVETARQMNRADLVVCVDRVGNLHGLLLDEDRRRRLENGQLEIKAAMRHAIAHASHIDTVGDGGKFDGRLGVCSGIETASLISDLHEFYGIEFFPDHPGVTVAVTAYVNEEMTFTGQGVSMSGSAAIAGQAEPERIYRMRNLDGDSYGELLIELLRELRSAVDAGEIKLLNRFAGDDHRSLLEACFDPTDFYTPHHFERHIEQGPVLDRKEVPIVMVSTIMGIHQEDYRFDGAAAERAGLEFGVRLRDLADEDRFEGVRITVGIMEPIGEVVLNNAPAVAFRCEIAGERNHAGSIAMEDRRDPGVAAGRLARGLARWADEHGHAPIVGDLSLLPGMNRNVIPGEARLTLALAGEQVPETAGKDLRARLEGLAAQTLAVGGSGGAGVHITRLEPASFINTANRLRLSIDLRAPSASAMTEFLDEMKRLADEVATECEVSVDSSVEQHLEPSPIEETGQVLFMERSYGGSHNPNENELTVDLARGSILQFMVTRKLLGRDDLEGLNLFRLVEDHMPARWLEEMPRFVSGALHDTCNISARARESAGQVQ